MSLCNPGVKLNPLNFCNPTLDDEGEEIVNFIYIGHVGDALGGSYFAYFRQLATGALYVFQVGFNALENGYYDVYIEFNGNFPLANGLDYEMWVGKKDEGPSNAVPIIIDDPGLSGTGCVTAKLFIINGERVYDFQEEAYIEVSEQTMKCLT